MLKDALAIVRRALKDRQFSARGTTLHRRTDSGNTLLLSVQKSTRSTSTESVVTINYGVYSALIGSCLQDDDGSSADVMKAHWRKRLSDDGREKWLHIRATDGVQEAARLMLDAIEGLLPELQKHSTDDVLRDEWLSGASPGIGDMERLLFLAVLLSRIGPPGRLEGVIDELRALVAGSVHEGLVKHRLAIAGVRVA